MKNETGPVLAVIPARGGSKGVPRKNLRPVGGRSLLARAIASAAPADVVVVSTEDPEIAAAAESCGVPVPFLRPAELASDTAPTIPVVSHAVLEMERLHGRRFGTVLLLEPTSPFRTADHVVAVLKRLADGCASVVTVCDLERKPQNIFVKQGHLTRYIREPAESFSRRQDMSHLCRVNSAVYAVRREAYFEEQAFMPHPCGYVEMSHRDSVNIDDPLDLEWADFLARRHNI